MLRTAGDESVTLPFHWAPQNVSAVGLHQMDELPHFFRLNSHESSNKGVGKGSEPGDSSVEIWQSHKNLT